MTLAAAAQTAAEVPEMEQHFSVELGSGSDKDTRADVEAWISRMIAPPGPMMQPLSVVMCFPVLCHLLRTCEQAI